MILYLGKERAEQREHGPLHFPAVSSLFLFLRDPPVELLI